MDSKNIEPKFDLADLLLVVISLWVIIILFSSCKTTEYVEVPKEVIKTEYRDRVQKDTTYVKDSIFVKVKGDTIFQDRWHTQYVEKIRVDTMKVVDYKTETKVLVKEKQLSAWQQAKMHVGGVTILFLLLVVIALIVYGVIKIKKLIL